MAKLTVTQGLPASGKTTYARRVVAADPVRRARVNRDDARALLHSGYVEKATEELVTAATHAAIRALLQRGVDVYCDDTNLKADTVEELRQLARYTPAPTSRLSTSPMCRWTSASSVTPPARSRSART